MHFQPYKTILSPKGNMNLYRGCLHGCIYCDARSACYQMQHPFEDIEVKENAPAMLEQELGRRRKKCMIFTGARSDPYNPLETELTYTRRCLKAIERHGFGVSVLTKSARILRDLDLYIRIHQKARCVIQMTMTTYDENLCKIIEPNVSTTKERAAVLESIARTGIPTVVWLSPILPFINDTEENLAGILSYCVQAGVQGIVCFGMGVTLREGDRAYFYKALDRHFPGLREKYIRRYGNAYECTSDRNDVLMRQFKSTCKEHGILYRVEDVFAFLEYFPNPMQDAQLSLL